MKIKVPHKNYSIVELFDTVASFMGHKPMDLKYDCRCINVAQNIENGFFTYYREMNPDMSEDEFKRNMIVLLLLNGPKADKQLAEDEVEVFDGFIC